MEEIGQKLKESLRSEEELQKMIKELEEAGMKKRLMYVRDIFTTYSITRHFRLSIGEG